MQYHIILVIEHADLKLFLDIFRVVSVNLTISRDR